MACAINSGITRDCRDASPGLVEIYITEKANSTIAITSASGILTNSVSFLTTGKKFWTFELEYGQADETEVLTANTNGTLSNKQTVNFYIPKKQASVAQLILLLAKQDLLIIVKDKMGKYRLMGEEFGMRLVTSTAASGKVGNDNSGYSLVFEGEERVYANEVGNVLLALLKVPA
jgi:hypothetical protein